MDQLKRLLEHLNGAIADGAGVLSATNLQRLIAMRTQVQKRLTATDRVSFLVQG